jgi:hypothetical protein
MTRVGDLLRPGRLAASLFAAAVLSAAASGIAAADDQSPLPVAPAAPPPAADPSFLHELGVLWNGSFGDFDVKMKKAWDRLDAFNRERDQAAKNTSVATQQALKDAARATTEAATAVVRLPAARVFELRERCRIAGNGAPDCQTTAADVCRGKDFKDGRPLDVSTQQDCPARVMLSGQPPADGLCTDKTFLLRVICQ